MSLLIAIVVVMCTRSKAKGAIPQPLTGNEGNVQNNVDFSINLYKSVIDVNRKGSENLILSPTSIQSCFSMLFLGSKGKVAEELQKGLQLGTADRSLVGANFEKLLRAYEGNPFVAIANKIIVKSNTVLNAEYKENVKKYFHTDVEVVNTIDMSKITNVANEWVKQKTHGKIDKILSPDDVGTETALILLNAVYFKGMWKHPFNKADTKRRQFWMNEKESIYVDMMRLITKLRFGRLSEQAAYVVELPYVNSSLSMLLIVPVEREGLKKLEQNFKLSDLEGVDATLFNRQVHLELPKFRIESKIDLKYPLQQLGLSSAFTNGDFSDISNEVSKISSAIHRAVIEVNEEGTEAAAATEVSEARAGPFPIIVNHPFMFLVRDNLGQILFEGRVLRPN